MNTATAKSWGCAFLGLRVGDNESERTWQDFFTWLKARGLHDVDVVVCDHHGGLVNAIQVQFQGTTWQHCQTHLTANIADAPLRRCKLRPCAAASHLRCA